MLFELLSQNAECTFSLVFSLWTTTLDLLGSALSRRSMQFVRIDGGMTLEQRRDAIMRFERQPDIRIMLLTLGTGAVG
jgi:SNF2 family DNA or RNA helicase